MNKRIVRLVPVLVLIAIVLGLVANAEAKRGSRIEGVVNINSATQEELTLVPGIGPSKATAIVNYRESEKFNTVEDLMKVKGIGEKLFNKIQAYITLEGPTTAKMVKDASLNLETPTVGGEG